VNKASPQTALLLVFAIQNTAKETTALFPNLLWIHFVLIRLTDSPAINDAAGRRHFDINDRIHYYPNLKLPDDGVNHSESLGM
jgi:hypothetical protein